MKTRFAPSPTGDVHVGSLRTALYNYLYAKKYGGPFLLRIEDTDRTRFVEGAEEGLVNALEVSGLSPDEGITKNGPIGTQGPYRQSERLELYQPYVEQLIEQGDAYYCFCSKERLEELKEQQRKEGISPKYDGHCRDLSKEEIQRRLDAGEEYVIRLKLPPHQDITFEDKIRGKVTINTDDMDDQVLIKSDGYPTYHFAVVVDDHLMDVTDVIRGEEWLTSTPKHVYLYDCFGWEKPNFVHLPNILNSQHKKLSKREGDVSVESFLKKGYLPEALVNYLALLGWNPGTEQEIFDLDELIKAFDLEHINHSGAVFDIEKLNWMNSQYIKSMTTDQLREALKPYLKEDISDAMLEILKERLEYLEQAPEIIEDSLEFSFEPDEEVKEILADPRTLIVQNELIDKLSQLNDFKAESIQKIFKEIQKENKDQKIRGKMLYMPARLLITGKKHGPDLAQIIEVLGPQEVLARLDKAKNLIEEKDE